MRWLTPQESLEQTSGASQVCPLGISFMEFVGWCSGVVGSQPQSVFVLELLGRDYRAGQGELPLVLGSGLLS